MWSVKRPHFMRITSTRSILWWRRAPRRWLSTEESPAATLRSAIRKLLARESLDIDKRLAAEIRPASAAGFRVSSKELPSYRFVDLFRAIELYTRSSIGLRVIDSEHDETLNSLLHAKRDRWRSRRITRSSSTAWPTGPEEETYFPVDRFWIFEQIGGHFQDRMIIRLRYSPLAERAILEVASEQGPLAEACVRTIIDQSIAESIYRNRILELSFEAGTKDEYGDVERAERLRVLFKRVEPVADSDIVIDEAVKQMLWRNVVDLHLRREVLKSNGVPVRRGVLLYGPPGTGKTFACRYLCGKLSETTRIIVAGTALSRARLTPGCGYSVLSGNSPGIHRDASAAGNVRRSGARALSDISTPLSIKAETMRRAWRSPVPTIVAASPRGSSPR
jgi:hypothetical protein